MVAELTRREKQANIYPDSHIDLYMKVRIKQHMMKTLVFDMKQYKRLKACSAKPKQKILKLLLNKSFFFIIL